MSRAADPADALLDRDALLALETAIQEAFASGRDDHLRVLGYGEISSVIAWDGMRGRVACKRLPLFSDRARFSRYVACSDRYIARLQASGIDVVPTQVLGLDRPGGAVVGYCVQPVLAKDTLGPAVFARDSARARALWPRVLERIVACVSPALGLDGQLSNWAVTDDDELRYLDVSTPMMRDADGREALDQDLFLASLPWALRGPVKRFMLGRILATYYDSRSIAVDFLSNLYKERLHHLLPELLASVRGRFQPEITEAELRRYYRNDARTWAFLQRLRHLDRRWQHAVRRRSYPFLLPGPIDR